jgi:hypothetical protein
MKNDEKQAVAKNISSHGGKHRVMGNGVIVKAIGEMAKTGNHGISGMGERAAKMK